MELFTEQHRKEQHENMFSKARVESTVTFQSETSYGLLKSPTKGQISPFYPVLL